MMRTLGAAACSAGFLLLFAGHAASPQAFVSGPALPAGQRELHVARQVKHAGFAHAKFRNEVRAMSTDEELHALIAESRKKIFEHRMEVFRKRSPSRGSRYEWQYKIALAKTFMKERELANAPEEVPEERPLFREQMIQDTDLVAAKREWYAKGRYRTEEKPRHQLYARKMLREESNRLKWKAFKASNAPSTAVQAFAEVEGFVAPASPASSFAGVAGLSLGLAAAIMAGRARRF
ncbi:unnamed protein product [Polarella glacialis]|uniref:Uncharacterized protein n=1 Tax=Polarella glacialis TaxID=89957 RepID=A0A813KD30_POLGL|nr:unnamed protein product [Polarella glacialis]CAE8703683.1 unnamed protein product [Polarella glacialis]